MTLPWDQLSVTVNNCGQVRCKPDWRLEPAWSERLSDYDLWLVWAGRGQMTLRGGRRIGLAPGTCMWMRPGGLYLGEHDPADCLGVSFVHFDLYDPASGVRPSDATLPTEAHELVDFQYGQGICRRITQLHQQGTPDADDVAAALLRGVLMDLETEPHAPRPRPTTAAERRQRQTILNHHARIGTDPAAAPTVAELAREAGYSPDHYTRVFRRFTGLTPQEALLQARISHARGLLSETGMSVGEIAEVLGYRDVYFFSRQFKQKVGRSPSAYRRKPG